MAPPLPYVLQVGYTDDGDTVYAMPKYRAPIRKSEASPSAWRQAGILRRCAAQSIREVKEATNAAGRFHWSCGERNVALRTCAEAALERSEDAPLRDALELLEVSGSNYGLCFDRFTPRNLATDARGNLVLLDPMYR